MESIGKALNQGRVVDLHCNLGEPGPGWEALESLIEKTLGIQEERKGKLILCKHHLCHAIKYPLGANQIIQFCVVQQIYFLPLIL